MTKAENARSKMFFSLAKINKENGKRFVVNKK